MDAYGFASSIEIAPEPIPDRTLHLARQFVAMVRERKSEQLDSWLEQASASPLQELHRFALGLRAEYGAMRAALRSFPQIR